MSPTVNNTQRDCLIDNLKFILISIVVIGHCVEPYINQASYFKALFVCIYSFHMPAFVFISGYLSKSENSISAYKIISTILIPYIIFSVLWRLRDGIHFKSLNLDILSPTFHLWYLLSLFNWKLLLPVMRTIKNYVIVSFVISLIIGFSPSIGNPASVARTLALLPFFILGSVCPASTLYAIHKRKYLVTFGILALAGIAYGVVHYDFNFRIVFWADPYRLAGYSNLAGFFIRLILMVIAGLIGLSVIVITPARKTFFTSLGAATITIYIFHGFFVQPFAVRLPLWNASLLKNVIIVAFPFVLIFLLSRPALHRFYNKVMSSITGRLLAG